MKLRQHLNRIQNILYSRQEINVEFFRVEELVPGREGIIAGRMRFWDGSLLEFREVLIESGIVLVKTDYVYHYQDANDVLIFRYDNAPHHPEVSTHPHHKHMPQGIETAVPPDLTNILKEIDQYLYP